MCSSRGWLTSCSVGGGGRRDGCVFDRLDASKHCANRCWNLGPETTRSMKTSVKRVSVTCSEEPSAAVVDWTFWHESLESACLVTFAVDAANALSPGNYCAKVVQIPIPGKDCRVASEAGPRRRTTFRIRQRCSGKRGVNFLCYASA